MNYNWRPHPTKPDTYIYDWEIDDDNGTEIISWFQEVSLLEHSCIHYYSYDNVAMDANETDDKDRITNYIHFCDANSITDFIRMLIKLKKLVREKKNHTPLKLHF